MSMLRICATPGCETWTLGQFCVDHETSPMRHQTLRRQPERRSTPLVTSINNPPLIATTQRRTLSVAPARPSPQVATDSRQRPSPLI